jgi:hypothetical protein
MSRIQGSAVLDNIQGREPKTIELVGRPAIPNIVKTD